LNLTNVVIRRSCSKWNDNQSHEDWSRARYRNVEYIKYTSDKWHCPM